MTIVESTSLGRLLLIDDDETFNRILGRALSSRGFAVTSAHSIDEARAQIANSNEPPFAVIDLNLAGFSGLQLIRVIKAASPAARVVVLTGYASISTAIDAIKLGADQYLAKPVDVDAIARALRDEKVPDEEAVPGRLISIPRLQWEHIQRVLYEHRGNISATARALDMHRRTLQRKLAKKPGPQ